MRLVFVWVLARHKTGGRKTSKRKAVIQVTDTRLVFVGGLAREKISRIKT